MILFVRTSLRPVFLKQRANNEIMMQDRVCKGEWRRCKSVGKNCLNLLKRPDSKRMWSNEGRSYNIYGRTVYLTQWVTCRSNYSPSCNHPIHNLKLLCLFDIQRHFITSLFEILVQASHPGDLYSRINFSMSCQELRIEGVHWLAWIKLLFFYCSKSAKQSVYHAVGDFTGVPVCGRLEHAWTVCFDAACRHSVSHLNLLRPSWRATRDLRRLSKRALQTGRTVR